MITYTHDANFVLKKWSTWLAIVAASLFAGVMTYNQFPLTFREAMPGWFQSAMGIAAVLSAMAVPIATSIQQKSIPTVSASSYELTSFDSDPISDEKMP